MAFFASAPAHRDTIVMTAFPGGSQVFVASVSSKVQKNISEVPRVLYIYIAVCGIDVPWQLFRLLYSIVEDGDKNSKLPVRFSSDMLLAEPDLVGYTISTNRLFQESGDPQGRSLLCL